MTEIPQGWSGDAQRISKTYNFKNFAQALAFMVEVGFYCEKADHHPEWKNIYNKILVELTTHASPKPINSKTSPRRSPSWSRSGFIVKRPITIRSGRISTTRSGWS